MKIVTQGPIPVLPPAPWLVESEKQFKDGATGLRPLGTSDIGSADLAWKTHKAENGFMPNVIAFGKPEGPADKLRPYAEAIRAKRRLK